MGKLLHLIDGRPSCLNPIIYKTIPNFSPRKIEMEPCASDEALSNFACTRLKLQNILRRHERIDSILFDVQKRIGPMQFLLSTADEKNLLNRSEMKKCGNSWDQLGYCNLCEPLGELKMRGMGNKVLQDRLNDIKNLDLLGEASFARVCCGLPRSKQSLSSLNLVVDEVEDSVALAQDDWKTMVKKLNQCACELTLKML